MLADDRPIVAQIGPGKRQQDQRGKNPAQRAERDRREIAGGITADVSITRSEQHGEHEQHIGRVV
jgi:hypothetical protein